MRGFHRNKTVDYRRTDIKSSLTSRSIIHGRYAKEIFVSRKIVKYNDLDQAIFDSLCIVDADTHCLSRHFCHISPRKMQFKNLFQSVIRSMCRDLSVNMALTRSKGI